MKEKINIAELLKDLPSGMELDCTMYEDCKFLDVGVDPGSDYLIRITTPCGVRYLDKYGHYTHDDKAKCVIFPKGKTTWEGFVPPCKFKEGDIIVDKWGNIAIYKQIHESYETPCVDFHCRIYQGNKNLFHTNFLKGSLEHCGKIDSARFATEEEKRELFDAIKANGYKWNETTKTLEKLIEPKFKVGDIIKNKETYKRRTITKTHQDCYECDNRYILTFENLDNWELVELKFKVGDKIKLKGGDEFGIITHVSDCFYTIKCKNNIHYWSIAKQDEWELAPNKFDINTLIPFESRVLVRNSDTDYWVPDVYGGMNEFNLFLVLYKENSFYKCIPYEGNEHLIGKTDDCNEYYKIWE